MPFFVNSASIQCGKCRKIHTKENPDQLPLYKIEEFFEKEGWLVAYGDGLCLCPACKMKHDFKAERAKIAKRIKQQMEPKPVIGAEI